MEYLEGLNQQQKQAVLERHPRLCVIAGPGCGKTKTLVSKAIHLLTSQQAQPQNILVLTFAKKAIKEIKKRVFSHIAEISPKDLHIYNFHSFCFKVLNTHSHLLGFPASKFPVYDRHEQEEVIKKIIRQNNYNADQKEINTILSCISNWKNGKLAADPLQFDELTKKRNEIYEKYQEYLKANKALDFNDLLLYTINLFNYHPSVRKEYQENFTHILLDEFQDINSTQWEIIKLILGNKQSVFLVGDPNQAIYGFQGATPQLIASLTQNQEWKTIYLNINYRSTNNILHLANSFVKKNQPKLVNNLLVSPPSSQPPAKEMKVSWFIRVSASFVVRQILWLLSREKFQFSDIAILYRNNYLSGRIEQELVAQKIPYEILGSFKFIEREEIKDVLAFPRAILYQDNLTLLRILRLQEKIGVRTIEKIELNSEKEGKSIYEYLNKNFTTSNDLIQENFTPTQVEKISEVIQKINTWKNQLETKLTLSNFFSGILTDFNYLEHLKSKSNHHEREKNIQQFLNIAQSWENRRRKEYPNLAELINGFCEWIIVAFEDKKLLKTRNNLILSSIHQAKGLEFEVVFFVYLDQGTLPYRETQDLTEEKRLFYVGITRAKQLLYLVSSNEAYSPFLEELDKTYLQKFLR
jgi:DNA helicase II / ATP-dependent DNA helicase PcrA